MSGESSAVAAVIVLAAVALAGCSTSQRNHGESVAELHLFGLPVALNLDGKPGPDGIGVRVYASAAGLAKGMPIARGNLEVMMFDGIVGEQDLASKSPRHTWKLPAAALKPFASETSIGTGYQLALRWDQDSPRTSVVTVFARYRTPDGATIQSAANTVSVALK